MFRLEDVVCCGQDCCEEEHQASTVPLTSNKAHLAATYHWDMSISYLTGSTHKEEQDVYTGCKCLPKPADMYVVHQTIPRVRSRLPGRSSGGPLRHKLSVMNDWAASLRSRHAKGIVHGNLTPKSVCIVHGKGILINQNDMLSLLRGSPDDDVYDARWAATEFFRCDGSDPRPTKMSDVYSFACLMLQMLTECVPYCGTKRPEQVVYLKYLCREPIDVQTPKVADHYIAFMRWCWSLEPEKRPTMETVTDFIQEEIKGLV